MELSTKLISLTGIGTILGKKLAALNLFTIEDLINHYPFRYEDFSNLSEIPEISVGETVTVKGDVWTIQNTYTKSRKVLTKAIVNDSKATIDVIWFNQPWLIKNIKPGDRLQLSGKVKRSGSHLQLISPSWEKIISDSINNAQQTTNDQQSLHTGRLVPVYPETYGLTSKWIRQKIAQILPNMLAKIDDPLPEELTKDKISLQQALQQIHFPKSFKDALLAKDRLSFDELFFIQLQTQMKRQEWQKTKLFKSLEINKQSLKDFQNSLPFDLTKAQIKVIDEVLTDISKEHPMNRLVQGEVGSGKTVVAAAIIHQVFLNNLKSVLMAPTEILAFQHFDTLTKLLEPFGIRVGIYTGSRKTVGSTELTVRRRTTHNKQPTINPDVIVGTHALLSDKLKIEDVGLVVIDEQQRFGVEQRSLLRSKAKMPHFLTMTATPIPRTVALTIYGDLDISIIDELPKGRKEVKTFYVPHKKRQDSYEFIAKHIKAGEQAYIITPLIEESETLQSAKAAKVEFERLKSQVFPEFKIGLLHGKLKSKEKEEVINQFKNHQIDILVSTSVVEVGVDVPNATIMVIEGADRFGLAQLHQLRGRVGRGLKESYTFLFTEIEAPSHIQRVKNLENTHNGLRLAELDLKLRGSGEVFGTKQSGEWNLKIASLSDLKLIEETKLQATKILDDSPNLDKYPRLLGKLFSHQLDIMPD